MLSYSIEHERENVKTHKKIKLSLLQAVKTYGVVRCRGSHIF
jgi:hypothetical protein